MGDTVDRRPPGRAVRGRVAFVAAAVVFAVARALPFAHARPGLVLDSYDYIRLAHSKSLLGLLAAKRPPAFPFVMRVLRGNLELVTWVQFTLAVVAWITLAGVAARAARTAPAKIVTVAVVLLVGSSLDVVQWDLLIGTESLSISVGVLLVAAAFWMLERVTPARGAVVAGLALLWGMLRDANAVVIGVVGVVLAISVLARRSRVRASLLAVAGVCVATLALSLLSADVGGRWQQPIQNVVTLRVLPSPERRAYFLDHGLPLDPGQARVAAGRCINPSGAFLCVRVTDPAFYRWISHDARRVYFNSWWAFPATTLWEPLAHIRLTVGTEVPLAATADTGLHDPTARWIENVVFPRSPRVLVGWLAVEALALAITVWRRGWTRSATLPVVLVLLTYPHLWAIWTGDAADVARHALGASVQLRLGLWLLAGALVDAALVALQTRVAAGSNGGSEHPEPGSGTDRPLK